MSTVESYIETNFSRCVFSSRCDIGSSDLCKLRIEWNYRRRPLMTNSDNWLQIELNAYKKFATVYRPFMIKIKEELCAQLAQKNHILFQLAGKSLLETFGNIFDPCPFTVFVTARNIYLLQHQFWKCFRDTGISAPEFL